MNKHAILSLAVTVVAGTLVGCEPNRDRNAREAGAGINPGDDGIRSTYTTTHNDPVDPVEVQAGVDTDTVTRPDYPNESNRVTGTVFPGDRDETRIEIDSQRTTRTTSEPNRTATGEVEIRGGSIDNRNETYLNPDGTTRVGGGADVDVDRTRSVDRTTGRTGDATAGGRVVDDYDDYDDGDDTNIIRRDGTVDRRTDDARQAGDRINAGDSRTIRDAESIDRNDATPRGIGEPGSVGGDPGSAGGPSSVDRTRGNTGTDPGAAGSPGSIDRSRGNTGTNQGDVAPGATGQGNTGTGNAGNQGNTGSTGSTGQGTGGNTSGSTGGTSGGSTGGGSTGGSTGGSSGGSSGSSGGGASGGSSGGGGGQ